MSGDFSEILCYYLIPEKSLPECQLRPPKWKWKEAKNIPAHFTDVIVFHRLDPDNPSEGDSLISIESKSRATKPSSTESSLQKAINDAIKDSVSRLAESFFHLKTRYKDDRNAAAVHQLERFMDAAKFPKYLKHFKAVATVDESFATVHLDNIVSIPGDIVDSFEAILVRIPDLQEAYTRTFANTLNS
jgi:hypothetical protein